MKEEDFKLVNALRKSHWGQLYGILLDAKDSGIYSGNRAQYEKRLDDLILLAEYAYTESK